MNKRILTRGSLLLAAAGAVIATAVPAQANPTPGAPHPAPLCGALNMVHSSPAFYPDYAVSNGMDIAMNRIWDSGQGRHGWYNMFHAVDVSTVHCSS